MSISEISEINKATNYALESRKNNSAKKDILNLFEGKKFYNGGNTSANSVAEEIKTLQNFITEKNSDYSQKCAALKSADKELQDLKKQLEDEILDVTKQADKEEKEQRNQIRNAINEVNQMYMNGDIEKEEMSSELSKKISRYSSLSSGVTSKASRLNGTKTRIASITGKIASLIDSANSIEAELNIAKGTMSIMQNLMSKMEINGSVNAANNESENNSKALGFSANGKNYNFIIDRNSDNKLNDSSEFLGANSGFQELKNIDKNKDNIVSRDELNESNMFVLVTDNQTGSNKFMSILESGISSIDLSTITSEDFNELEEPEIQNIFTVNTVSGVSTQGYEDSLISGFNNTEMIVGIDESVLKNAKNIFSKGASLSSNGLEENVVNAAIAIKAAQADVKRTASEMAVNDNTASSKLTKQERPETKEEKEAREAEEAQKEKEAAAKEEEEIKAQKEKEEKEEALKAEKEEKEKLEKEKENK